MIPVCFQAGEWGANSSHDTPPPVQAVSRAAHGAYLTAAGAKHQWVSHVRMAGRLGCEAWLTWLC